MEAVEIVAVVAATYGVLMALSPILQIRRIVEQGSSEDVSLGYFSVLTFGFSLWLLYGLLDRQWPLIVPNAVALAVSAITMAVTLRFRRGRGTSADGAAGERVQPTPAEGRPRTAYAEPTWPPSIPPKR